MPATDAPETMTPPLKWAGGKRWQVPQLLPLWQPHTRRRLVEPFAGGLAVTLRLSPDRALLNDVNPHLVNFYRWLKKGLTTAMKMENNRALFYRHRERFNDLVTHGHGDSAEAPALF
jgi:DNA adenine methylase